jgi:hypothetical protein
VKPLETIYWLRFGLGMVAALVCTGYNLATGTISNAIFNWDSLLNGISLAIIVYVISYYYLKYRFRNVVQKTSKIVSAGIGIYFLSWIVFWTLLYTIIAGAPSPSL